MTNERLEFEGAHGAKLSARLARPADRDVKTYALFAHCFTCSKDLKAAVNLSRALTAAGIGVLRFDFTGLGESEGDFVETTFSSNIDDLVAAARFLEEEFEAPQILIGHSLGGAAVLQTASRIDSVRAVATIGAPFRPEHVKHLFTDSLSEIEERGEAEVRLAGRTFTVSRDFVRDLGEQNMREAIGSLGRSLIIFHSPIDQTVAIDNAAEIYTAARHPKSFVSLDDADHLLTDEADSRYVGTVLAAWARRYVDAPAVDEEDGEPAAAEGQVVTSTERGAFRTEVRAGRHRLLADEPKDAGGDDLGPTPYDLLAAGLGACTTMTLKMYAARKEWPLEESIARVSHERVHGEDSANCDDREPRVDRFTRELVLRGDLTDEQRERLVEIAERCPVHRTLGAGVFVETVVADST